MLLKRTNKQVVPLAYPFYYIPVVIIALTGFIDSVYLSVSHYRNYMDMGYHSFCAISRAINCDTVSQSPYSIFMGVPIPVWGVMGYCFFLFLLAFAGFAESRYKRVWTLMMLVSLVFCIYSAILAFVSSYFIHSYCIMCILSYAVNLALLFYSWIIRNRFACESVLSSIKLDVFYLLKFPKVVISVTSIFFVSALAMMLTFPPYWQMNPPILSQSTPTGITEDGHPWIGAEYPELIITEFSDYRCFQCKKMHYFLRRLIENQPDKLRLIHRHFPMDDTINPLVKEPFHPGTAELSMLAIYATEKGKFWEMNDYLFSIPKDIESLKMRTIGESTGIEFKDILYMFSDKHLWNVLWKDIKDGIEVHQLTGTPGFIINGQTYQGQIPADILKPYLK